MPRVFISYVRENSDTVQRLANELTAHGVKVWLDKNLIKPGFRWKDAIREGISQGDFFLACFSEQYHNRSKTYMNEELILAIEELRQRSSDRAWFIPVLLSETQVPDRDIGAGETLRSIQWVELYKDWEQGIRSILSVIQPDAVEAPAIDYPSLSEEDWSRLLRQIAARKCTPFLGPALDDGVLPYEGRLAREWALQYNYPPEDPTDFARVAQFLTRIDPALPEELLRDRIHRAPPPDFSEAGEPHALLAELPVLIYMTANYDDFMERALRARKKDPKSEFSRWNDRLRSLPSVFDDLLFEPGVETPVVFHIYGHTDLPDSMVVTEDDHLEFVSTFGSEGSLPLRVRRALTTTSPLLLGFSLSEGKFRNLFRLLLPYYRINLYRPAIQDRPAARYLQEYFPNLTGGNYWGTLREFMAELRARWETFSGGENA